MKVKKKTAEVLRAAVAALERHPSKFNMDDWFLFGDRRLKPKDSQDFCGTACCLAGQIFLNGGANRDLLYQYERNENNISLEEIFPKKLQKKLEKFQDEHNSISEYRDAAEIIADLTSTQGENLFFIGGWPPEFGDRYRMAKTKKNQVKILKERVEYFIETGE